MKVFSSVAWLCDCESCMHTQKEKSRVHLCKTYDASFSFGSRKFAIMAIFSW